MGPLRGLEREGNGMGKGNAKGWEELGREGMMEGRVREGRDEGRRKRERGYGRDERGHRMGRGGKVKGKEEGVEREGLQPPNSNFWSRHCLQVFSEAIANTSHVVDI